MTLDPIESDIVYGPLDESEDAITAANELAEKNDDPDMQMSENVNVQLIDECYNCFNDGVTKIDYVLVYEEKRTTTVDQIMVSVSPAIATDEIDKLTVELQKQRDRSQFFRRRFLNHLTKKGLLTETDTRESDQSIVHFIKIHLPWSLLLQYAEDLNFRVPIRTVNNYTTRTTFIDRLIRILHISPNLFSSEAPKKYYDLFTSVFEIAKQDRFMGNNHFPVHFTNTQRSFAVHEILQTTPYGRIEKGEIGIDRLVRERIFQAAYPLHEGNYKFDDTDPRTAITENNPRRILYDTWARYKIFYKHQPLDLIRDYFGEKVSLYFAWLGLYTTWLLPAAIVGIFVFLFGFIYLSRNVSAYDFCTLGKNVTMCPMCDGCGFWYLSDICSYARLGIFIDHPGIVFYAIFMSFWAFTFLKHWKQKNAKITHKWDLMEFEEEENRPRPEFALRATTVAQNPVTGILEPYFPASTRLYRITVGIITLTVMIIVVIIFIIAIVVYRIMIRITLFQRQTIDIANNRSNLYEEYPNHVASISGAILNLIVIMILGYLYEIIAFKLTQWEMHRTQTEFDNYFTVKVFIFQFVNLYSSCFYIAFVKGKDVGYPGNYTKIFGLRQEECEQGTCLIELAIQLAIIMIGKQAISNVQEIMWPKILSFYQRWQIAIPKTKSTTQWEDDFKRSDFPGLFHEYLEIVLQFGFITIFVAAFPIAPLFALINNWIEIRLDAKKLVCETRRPIAFRASTIGIWFTILEVLAYLAIVVNAFLIAFTSEFLTKIVYQYSMNSTDTSYTNFILATGRVWNQTGFVECKYRDFRDENGKLTRYFWILLAVRLGFVILFEHAVFILCRLTDAIFPDVPDSLLIKIRREKYLAKRALQNSSDFNKVFEGQDDERAARSKLPRLFRTTKSKTTSNRSSSRRKIN